MATLYGVNATKMAASPMQLAENGQQGGVVKSIYDTYELTADTTGGTDTLEMGGKLPQGARVIDVRIMFDDLDGSGGTLDIGWKAGDGAVEAADADGFLADVDVTSAGSISMFEDQSSRPGFQKVFNEAVQPVIAFDGDCDATSGTIHLEILYV
jgi:hypothetical protein